MITRQEMFNRAWNGLKAQGWQRSYDGDRCVYVHPSGLRCAWGHVDQSLTDKFNGEGDVYYLSSSSHESLASELNGADLDFAAQLQFAHDHADERPMEGAMRSLAFEYGLTIPDEAP